MAIIINFNFERTMKNRLPKFMVVSDSDQAKDLIFRSQYPKYVIELLRKPEPGSVCLTINEIDQDVIIRRDLDHFGEVHENYLTEAIRWWKYEADDYQTITYREIENLTKNPVDLKYIFEWVNASFIAEDCFGKDRTWLYQRLNNNKVNGKPADFNLDNKIKLAQYFRERAHELLQAADYLDMIGDEIYMVERFLIIETLESMGILAHAQEREISWFHVGTKFSITKSHDTYALRCNTKYLESFYTIDDMKEYMINKGVTTSL